MTKHMRGLPKAMLVIVVVIALAGLGLVWTHWTDTLEVRGEVQTGTLDMVITSAATDDDGVVNSFEIIKEPAPSTLYTYPGLSGPSSRDPASYRAASRHDKDVARCWVNTTYPGKLVNFNAENTYPSYHRTIQSRVRVDGSVPMRNQAAKVYACGPNAACPVFPDDWTKLPYDAGADVFRYDGPDGDVLWELELQDAPGGRCGHQFDPGDTSVWTVGFHVLQDADQDAGYQVAILLDLVNWNEWDINACEGFDQFEP